VGNALASDLREIADIIRLTKHHGGLTPAALVGMRMYIAKIGFSSADIRTATEERGA
jgi:hypothetical protein